MKTTGIQLSLLRYKKPYSWAKWNEIERERTERPIGRSKNHGMDQMTMTHGMYKQDMARSDRLRRDKLWHKKTKTWRLTIVSDNAECMSLKCGTGIYTDRSYGPYRFNINRTLRETQVEL
jgi:hypothetical protein